MEMYHRCDLQDLKTYLVNTYNLSGAPLASESATEMRDAMHNATQRLHQSTSSSAGWSTPWMWALGDSGRNPNQTVIVNNNTNSHTNNASNDEKGNNETNDTNTDSDLTMGKIAAGVGMTASSLGAGYYLFGKYLDQKEHQQLLTRLNRWKELRPYRRQNGSYTSPEEQELDELIQKTLAEAVSYTSSQFWLQTCLVGAGLGIAGNYFYLNSLPTFYGTLGIAAVGVGYGLVQRVYHDRSESSRQQAAQRAVKLIDKLLELETQPHPPPYTDREQQDLTQEDHRTTPPMAITDMEIIPGIF